MNNYAFTPRRQAALRKAQLISARKRAAQGHKLKATAARGSGLTGLQNNTRPYLRTNKLSTTVGVNSGTVIPGTRKRIAIGAYARVETIDKKNTALDKVVRRGGKGLAPAGTKRRAAVNKLKKHIKIQNPAIRVNVGGAQARLGTSRDAGPTIIVRKGQHKVSRKSSKTAVAKYNTRMTKIQSTKVSKPRPQRRGKK